MTLPLSLRWTTRRESGDYAPWMAALSSALTLIVLVPAHVYLANRSRVLVFFDQFFLTASLLALGAAIVVCALLAILPRAVRQKFALLLFAGTVLFWIHAYCLVWPYEVLDGRHIPWSDYPGRTLVDATLWVTALALAWWQAPRLCPRLVTLCGCMLLMQVLSLGVTALRTQNSPLDFSKQYYVETRQLFEFSSRRNVIVLVLDEFQSDIFAEAVLPWQEYRRQFAGFTYFANTTAGANYTELAIPALLTGQIYGNHWTRDVYLQKAYLGNSLPATLKRQGFDVELYPWRGFANDAIHYDEEVASNFVRRPQPADTQLIDAARLIDLGLFRSAPQFAKRFVYRDSAWLLTPAFTKLSAELASSGGGAEGPGQFVAELPAGIPLDNPFIQLARQPTNAGLRFSTTDRAEVFKFYHLAGMHVPVRLKRDLVFGAFAYNRANYDEQAEAYARIVGAFLNELRRIGAYDNSLIIIAGDHGSGRSRDLYVQPDSPERTAELDRTATERDFQHDKARGLPLLLVKRLGATGDLRTSQAPASLVDIPATVFAELRLNVPLPGPAIWGQGNFRGMSVFDLNENQSRVRYYGATRWAPQKTDHVDALNLYRVDGPGWSDRSWSFVRVMEPPATNAKRAVASSP